MAKQTHKRPPIPAIIALAVVIIGGGIWWWWSATNSTPANQYSGSVEANTYQVSPAMAGRVLAVKVSEGDQVAKGQALVQLDPAAMKLQLRQAQEGVKAAQAAVTNAENDGSAADVKAAKAKVAQAQASVGLAQIQLGYATITAPASGVVTSVVTNAGQNGAPGRTMVTILNPGDLFVRIYVPETQIGNVAVGQNATITTDSVAQQFSGHVSFIASQSEFTPNTVQTKDQRTKLVYEVRIAITDPGGALKAGLPVDVTLH